MSETPPETKTPEAKPKGRQMYKMRVSEVRDYTPRIRELFVICEEPAAFQFKAGQFVMLHVPAEPKALLRAYSIASDDRITNGYRLIFNYVDGGAASQFVWNLKGGETLDFTGPFGRLLFKEPPTEQIVFLNTGSGISQHFCYMESNLQRFGHIRYRMLFGVRTEQDTYYASELDRLRTQLKDFHYEFVLSRPSADWKGKKGYVQNFISDFNYMEIPTTFYLCGNGHMIKDVKHILIEKGFDPTRIFAEAFD
jgi:CDP-4-dehydro-6-deoxyglucose reductase, E3